MGLGWLAGWGAGRRDSWGVAGGTPSPASLRAATSPARGEVENKTNGQADFLTVLGVIALGLAFGAGAVAAGWRRRWGANVSTG